MDLIAAPDCNLKTYLKGHQDKELLRFITCGSVDDGKSTLIGRLLYESHKIYDDQLAALTADSKKFGTTGTLDFSLLVDGLAAEREQAITIDVAYRFFSTDKRQFIIADTPGHEQYTRNMATGASSADLALILIDARKGLVTQTRRHSFIVAMLGIKQIILAVNKMDLINFDKTIYQQIKESYLDFAQSIGLTAIQAIPLSALAGDNIVELSSQTPWYQGPTLLQLLEEAPLPTIPQAQSFRMPVQWVNRPRMDFRGYSGRIVSGCLHRGSRVKILPGQQETEIVSILTYDGELDIAVTGQSITCLMKDDIDISRGSLLVSADDPCEVADQFEAKLLWMAKKPMVAGRQYLIKLGTATAVCSLSKPKYLININSLEQLAAKELHLNEIGLCNISIDRPLAFEPYEKNRNLGGFILIDRLTQDTVAAGLIHFALRRSTNIPLQNLLVNQSMRSDIKMQKPLVLWFTGLSGAGKSTIANLVEKELNNLGKHTMLLDGDNIRHGLNRDLGFSEADRIENIRRIAEVAKLMSEAGLITLVAFISPFAADRAIAKTLIGEQQFVEIFIDAPLEIVEERDIKGLYKKARAGEIMNFTGIGSPYENPESPDLHLNTVELNPEKAANQVIKFLQYKAALE